MTEDELRSFLDEKVDAYNRKNFIESDPISIPHQFSEKQDIEIAGLLSATIAWGQRKTIINNAHKIVSLMEHEPYAYVMNSSKADREGLKHFKHRTFNGDDLNGFVMGLRHVYQTHGSLERAFSFGKTFKERISQFKTLMFEAEIMDRTKKHISDPLKGSAAKRINMYLRWMIRRDNRGVDFGIWESFSSSELFMPLDVHTGNTSRKLGLLQRKQNDWKAVKELTDNLRRLDSDDPVKYDFALFGLGVFDGF